MSTYVAIVNLYCQSLQCWYKKSMSIYITSVTLTGNKDCRLDYKGTKVCRPQSLQRQSTPTPHNHNITQETEALNTLRTNLSCTGAVAFCTRLFCEGPFYFDSWFTALILYSPFIETSLLYEFELFEFYEMGWFTLMSRTTCSGLVPYRAVFGFFLMLLFPPRPGGE